MRERIIALTRSRQHCEENCCRLLSAVSALLGDTYGVALSQVNTSKLAGYSERLLDREFRPLGALAGSEKVRFLSSLSKDGVVCFPETVNTFSNRIFVVNDEHGAVSRLLLQCVRSHLLRSGYDIISCYCPMSPYEKLEHLLIPAAGIAFVTSNRFHDFSGKFEPYRIINAHRFSHKDALRAYRKRLRFNHKAATQLLEQAAELLSDAESLRGELAEYYQQATDFAAVERLTQEVLQELSIN